MKYLMLMFILVTGLKTYSQGTKAVGLRGGITSGITYKDFLNENIGFEFILSPRNKGLALTGLFEYHTPASYLFRENLVYYYGFGAHVGYYRLEDCNIYYDVNGYEESCSWRTIPAVGFDAIVGVEYRLEAYPIIVGIDLKPFVSIFGPYTIWRNLGDLALTIKYNFN